METMSGGRKWFEAEGAGLNRTMQYGNPSPIYNI